MENLLKQTDEDILWYNVYKKKINRENNDNMNPEFAKMLQE